MGFLKGMVKPEYLFRPGQMLRRIGRGIRPRRDRDQVVMLPWKARLTIDPRDIIGSVIWKLGVYELVVSETLWRLIDPGESVLDVGANIGHMTTLMAMRTGVLGRVTAFEPHPACFARLNANAQSLAGVAGAGTVRLRNVALSDETGRRSLVMPPGFGSNAGMSFIEESSSVEADAASIAVTTQRLDDLFPVSAQVPRLLKVDVEGHEYQVFRGAERLLRSHAIRDLVFEDHGAYPTRTMELVEACGYALYRLDRSFFGPLLVNPASTQPLERWEPSNFLATANPSRARERMKPAGWQCLR